MCGIAGFIDHAAGDSAPFRLGRMLDLIRHRGPDGEGSMYAAPLAMGMRRLSIIDLEGGKQPVWNEDGTVAVVFNGEIYNYLELRCELSSHQFRTHSDTEVLVHAYEEFGAAMVSRLRGMFAFALFDSRKRTLLIARDHFGQKPLYYFQEGARFSFASELKCLLSLPECPRDPDPDAFLDYVSWMSLPPPRTHFRGIWKLQAGHMMTIPLDDPAKLAVSEYWSHELSNPAAINGIDEAADAVDAALLDSLKIHMRADVPVGVLLSGGLDSRTVALYARQYAAGQLNTFSVGFGNSDSELPEAEASSRMLGTVHHSINVGPEEYARSLERVAWHLDEPVGDPAAVAVLKVCEFARSEVKVLLSGEGADELFAGYAGRYAGMLRTLERLQRLRWLRFVLPLWIEHGRSRWARLARRIHQSPATEVIRLRIEGLPGDIRNPVGLTAVQMRRLHQRTTEYGNRYCREQRDMLSSMLSLDTRWQLAESLLQKADKMSMAASIELRTPFLDKAVAACAGSIDSSIKLGPDGRGKLALRRCVERKLPGSAALPKKGFPVPLREWFTGPLRSRIEEEVLRPGSACSEQLEAPRLRRAWEEYAAGKWEGSGVFYALWLYELWRSAVRSTVSSAAAPARS
jgi:asparagine synthase (glutamine-hydrolysing)